MATATLATPTIPDALPAPDKVETNADSRTVTVRWNLPGHSENGGQEFVELKCMYHENVKKFCAVLSRRIERNGIVTDVVRHKFEAQLHPVYVHVTLFPRYSKKRFNENVAGALDVMAARYGVGDDQVTRFFDETYRVGD